MAEYPFFRFFTNDWLSHTRCLGAEARGVLIDVVCLAASCQRRGFLHTGDRAWTPSDIAKRLTGDPAVNQRALNEILAEGVLSQVDGCYCYAPMVEDAEYTATKAEAGAKGGKAKHAASKGLANSKQTSSNDLANTVANVCPQKSEVRSQNAEVRDQSADPRTQRSDQNQNHPSPANAGTLPGLALPQAPPPETAPAKPKRAKHDPMADASPAFRKFWINYPSMRKDNAFGCKNLWHKLKLDDDAEAVMAGLMRYKASEKWQKDNGQYIDSPHKWLNNRMWVNHPEPAPLVAPSF